MPIIEVITVDPFKRSMLFRRGGLNAKQIEADTGVKVCRGNVYVPRK